MRPFVSRYSFAGFRAPAQAAIVHQIVLKVSELDPSCDAIPGHSLNILLVMLSRPPRQTVESLDNLFRISLVPQGIECHLGILDHVVQDGSYSLDLSFNLEHNSQRMIMGAFLAARQGIRFVVPG